MHYSDNLEDGGVWGDIYDDPKVVANPSTATHQLEHGQKGGGGIWKQRGGTGILVMLIVLCNNGYFVVPIIHNGHEAKYGLSTESNLHGWGPNLATCYFNMTLKNAYKVYKLLHNKYYPGIKEMLLEPCIHNQFDSFPSTTTAQNETSSTKFDLIGFDSHLHPLLGQNELVHFKH